MTHLIVGANPAGFYLDHARKQKPDRLLVTALGQHVGKALFICATLAQEGTYAKKTVDYDLTWKEGQELIQVEVALRGQDDKKCD